MDDIESTPLPVRRIATCVAVLISAAWLIWYEANPPHQHSDKLDTAISQQYGKALKSAHITAATFWLDSDSDGYLLPDNEGNVDAHIRLRESDYTERASTESFHKGTLYPHFRLKVDPNAPDNEAVKVYFSGSPSDASFEEQRDGIGQAIGVLVQDAQVYLKRYNSDQDTAARNTASWK